jgi:hypothetical protein
MKRATVVFAVLALCLSVAPAVLAHTHQWGDAASSGHFRIAGMVSSVGAQQSTLTVKVRCAGRHMRDLRGREITVGVGEGAEIFLCQEGAKSAVALGDIKPADHVKVRGTFDLTDNGRVYTATKVVARRVLPHFRVGGTVDSVGTDSILMVRVWWAGCRMRHLQGQEINVNVGANTKIFVRQDGAMTAGALGDIQPGDRVMVCGTVDPSDQNTPVYLARFILDLAAAPPSPTS